MKRAMLLIMLLTRFTTSQAQERLRTTDLECPYLTELMKLVGKRLYDEDLEHHLFGVIDNIISSTTEVGASRYSEIYNGVIKRCEYFPDESIHEATRNYLDFILNIQTG